MNNYQSQMTQQQNMTNTGLATAGLAVQGYNANTLSNYYGGLPSASSYNGGPQPLSNGYYGSQQAALAAGTGSNGYVAPGAGTYVPGGGYAAISQ